MSEPIPFLNRPGDKAKSIHVGVASFPGLPAVLVCVTYNVEATT